MKVLHKVYDEETERYHYTISINGIVSYSTDKSDLKRIRFKEIEEWIGNDLVRTSFTESDMKWAISFALRELNSPDLHSVQIEQIFNLFTEKKEWVLSDTDFTVLTMKK